ncbi:MAG TPA: SIS domain-containing protein [Streptosporangiaceae bacterium]
MTAAGPAEVDALFRRREEPVRELAEQAGQVAAACLDMATRFRRGGKLIAFGCGAASTDAQHVAVEFVHPVIVGKPALPAISLTSDVATVTAIAAREGMGFAFARQLRLLAEPADIALGICTGPGIAGRAGDDGVPAGLSAARGLGLLTVALAGAGGGGLAGSPDVDHLLVTSSADPRIVKEIQVTTYHVLWELVHVFLEQPQGVVA